MILNKNRAERLGQFLAYCFAILLLAAPLYLVKFKVGPLPANLLMALLPLLWLLSFIQITASGKWENFEKYWSSSPKSIGWPIIIFVIAATISLGISQFSQAALGQYLVWIIQPIVSFIFAAWYWKDAPEHQHPLIVIAYVFLGASGIFALIQFFTFFGLPDIWWGNSVEPKRAISFFEHPNGFSLFVAPLAALVLPDLTNRFFKKQKSGWLALFAWLCGLSGLAVSLSRGSWFGVAAAVGVFVLIKGNWKVWLVALLAFLVAALLIFNISHLRYRLILPFYGEKSAVARLSLWQTGWEMVKDRPFAGQGLTGFSREWYKFNKDPNLDHYNFPHNIFLNFWIETGMLGLLSFLALSLWIIWKGLHKSAKIAVQAASLGLIAIFIHGLIDIPYFKNDLALEFWLIIALAVASLMTIKKIPD